MKWHAPHFTYGRPETKRLRERLKHDSRLQGILEYIGAQRRLVKEMGYSESSPSLDGHVKVGLHTHFPKKRGWYNRRLNTFNPERLEDVAKAAHRQGFGVISVSNYSDDQVFGHEPGVVFDFKDGSVVVLKSQEIGNIQPFGYHGRIRTGSLDEVIKSANDQGGKVALCHPSNLAYNGVGEEFVARNADSVIMETSSPGVNHRALYLAFADILSKEWSLKYKIPGVSVLDSHNLYFFGGFFVPEDSMDLSSAESVMRDLDTIFSLRRGELRDHETLSSRYLINTEESPPLLQAILGEGLHAGMTAVRSLPRKFSTRKLGVENKNIGLSGFDYRGKTGTATADLTSDGPHVYLLNGPNDTERFAFEDTTREGSPRNLIFYRRNGVMRFGTTFGNTIQFAGESEASGKLFRTFQSPQTFFFQELFDDTRFREFEHGLHPTYPIAAVKPSGERYMFVGKEFLPRYEKGDLARILFTQFYNKFVLGEGQEVLEMAALQSSLIHEGLSTVPPLYVELAGHGGRIIYPYCKFESASHQYSNRPQQERLAVLGGAADFLAEIKARGFFLTDMHPGNVARVTGDWFQSYDGGDIIPDVTVEGSSTLSRNGRSIVNPLALPFGPRVSFLAKAIGHRHRLVQNANDLLHFLSTYHDSLAGYRNAK